MKGFQGKGKDTGELVRLYEKLEQDWHAMKQNSNSKTASSRRYDHHHHAPNSNATMELEPTEQRSCCSYYYYSPRDIMYELQRESNTSPPPEEEEERNNNAMILMKDKDFEAREVFQEGVEATGGKLKGRRLSFNPTEDTESIADAVGLSPRPEVRSILSYDSDDEHEEGSTTGSKRVHGCALRCCCYSSSASSSSSSSYHFGAYVDSDQEVEWLVDLVAKVSEMRVAGAVDRLGNGRRKRCSDFLRWLAFALLVIAMCVSLARSSGSGHDDSEVVLVPT